MGRPYAHAALALRATYSSVRPRHPAGRHAADSDDLAL